MSPQGSTGTSTPLPRDRHRATGARTDEIQAVRARISDGRRRLRSASSMALVVPATRRSTLGDRAFPVAAARAWNALPQDVVSRVLAKAQTATDPCVVS